MFYVVFSIVPVLLKTGDKALESALIDQYKMPNRQCGGLNGGKDFSIDPGQ